jgi:hypothetical protein
MKDGRTHLAYTAEHAVDLETGAVVAVAEMRAIRPRSFYPSRAVKLPNGAVRAFRGN